MVLADAGNVLADHERAFSLVNEFHAIKLAIETLSFYSIQYTWADIPEKTRRRSLARAFQYSRHVTISTASQALFDSWVGMLATQ